MLFRSQQWLVNTGDKTSTKFKEYSDDDFKKIIKDPFLIYYAEGTDEMKQILKEYRRIKLALSKTTIVFYDPDDNNSISIFSGFAVKPMKNKEMFIEIYKRDIKFYLAFIKQIMCAGNEYKYNLLLDWMSVILQNPGFRTEQCLIFRSEQGTGKNTFIEPIIKIIGSDYASDTLTLHDIADQFNGLLFGKILFVVNEISNVANANGNNSSKYEEPLKGLITDKTITIELKGVNSYQAINTANMMMFTNNVSVVKMGSNPRRYTYFDVSSESIGEKKTFARIHKMSDDTDFLSALLTFFLTRKVDKDIFKCNEEHTLETLIEMNKTLKPFEECIAENIPFITSNGNRLPQSRIKEYYTEHQTTSCRCYKDLTTFTNYIASARFCKKPEKP